MGAKGKQKLIDAIICPRCHITQPAYVLCVSCGYTLPDARRYHYDDYYAYEVGRHGKMRLKQIRFVPKPKRSTKRHGKERSSIRSELTKQRSSKMQQRGRVYQDQVYYEDYQPTWMEDARNRRALEEWYRSELANNG